MAGRDLSLEDLAAEAGQVAEETAADAATDQATGEWVTELVETLDKRGILEPLLFGPENVEKVRETQGLGPAEDADAGDDAGGDAGGDVDLDAEGIASAGEAIMDQLGEDVTVAEVVEICRANPALVDQQLQDHL
jgi:hypothetical protein